MRKKTTEEFIKEATEKHNGFYDYSLVNYVNNKTKVEIICPVHGVFQQKPEKHLAKEPQGCRKCNHEEKGENRKITFDEFLIRSKDKHSNKYDYSLVQYIDLITEIEIICPIHGIFSQIAKYHMNGHGCKLCGIQKQASSKRFTLEEFISNAKKVHDNRYDYSLVDYRNNSTKVEIICPIHGVFTQTPSGHINSAGCSGCSEYKIEAYTTDEFIQKATSFHGNTYDYSLSEYVNAKTKVKIICKKHGEFWQNPNKHTNVNNPQGCPKCGNERIASKKKMTQEEFIEKSNIEHKNFYDYSKVIYIDRNTLIEIICPVHGVFKQKPKVHMHGGGCQECGKIKNFENIRYSVEDFINKASEMHKNFYDYSLVKYVNSMTKVEIVCPIHGSFWQMPASHTKSEPTGCPKCKESKGEKAIRLYLENHKMDYIFQYNPEDLSIKRCKFDFLVNDILIEYNGGQHYYPCAFGSRKPNACNNIFRKTVIRDYKKEMWCKENGRIVHIIPFWEYNNIPKILDAIFSRKEYSISKAPKNVRKFISKKERLIKKFLSTL